MRPPDVGSAGHVAVDPDAIWGLGTSLQAAGDQLSLIADRVRAAVAGLCVDLPAPTTIRTVADAADREGADLHRRVSRYLEAVAAARCAPSPFAVPTTPAPGIEPVPAAASWSRPSPSPLAAPDPDVPRYDDPCALDLLAATHLLLDVAGVVPGVEVVADGLNVALYALEGDRLNAGISLAAAVPFVGIGPAGARLVRSAARGISGDGGKALAQIGIRRSDQITSQADCPR